jgi:hypothetical protein
MSALRSTDAEGIMEGNNRLTYFGYILFKKTRTHKEFHAREIGFRMLYSVTGTENKPQISLVNLKLFKIRDRTEDPSLALYLRQIPES